eukprot:492412_1
MDILHCGDTNIVGTLDVYVGTSYYSLQLDTLIPTLIIDACSSNYDTCLYLYDSDGNSIAVDLYGCLPQSLLQISNLNAGNYQIAITSLEGYLTYDYFYGAFDEPFYDAFYDYDYEYSLDIICAFSRTTAPTSSPSLPSLTPTSSPTVPP